MLTDLELEQLELKVLSDLAKIKPTLTDFEREQIKHFEWMIDYQKRAVARLKAEIMMHKEDLGYSEPSKIIEIGSIHLRVLK